LEALAEGHIVVIISQAKFLLDILAHHKPFAAKDIVLTAFAFGIRVLLHLIGLSL